MNIYEIVKKYLIENNYDGLYHDGVCGCELNDLFPCGELDAECMPGYKGKCTGNLEYCDGDCDWHIYAKKQEV